MPISWNEICHNAIKFSRDWAGVKSEGAEKQTFWNEFFQVFGLKRRLTLTFEERVKIFLAIRIRSGALPHRTHPRRARL